ncbi:MAG TPA: tetratricopeptide repeat protein [Thermoanaerobaculia bacterium]|jgi:tetratricopeptide (TPR) repeat protein
MIGHYTADELADHLALPQASIEEHVRGCESCGKALARERTLRALLSDPAIWATAAIVREGVPPPADRREQYAELRQERADVLQRLQPLLRSIDTFRRGEVEHSRQFRSAAAVHVLTKEANRLRQMNPQFALMVAEAAIAIAEKLDRDQVSPASLGYAWLERAIACGTLGRHREADIAVSHSETAFDSDETTELWDWANVWFSRINARLETSRLDEALQYIDRAADAYLSYGDRWRYLRVLLVKAGILYLRGEYRESADAYEQILAMLHAGTDTEPYATAQHNVAHCYLGLGELDRAEALFSESLATWDRLGFEIQRTRALWGLASVVFVRGEWSQALAALEVVRRQLVALGVVNDDALVRLEMAEALLLLGRPAEVRPLLDNVVVQFATEGMMRNARMALAYIREAMQAERLTVRDLRHVRDYLANLPMRSVEPFVPLA